MVAQQRAHCQSRGGSQAKSLMPRLPQVLNGLMERLDRWAIAVIAAAAFGLAILVIARLSVLLERCYAGASPPLLTFI